MKNKIKIFIVIAALAGILFMAISYQDTETKLPAEETVSSADAEHSKEQEVPPPDTSSWPELITRTTGISYNPGYSICAKLQSPYRKRKEGVEPEVYVTSPEARYKSRFMDYRYTVLLDSDSTVKNQLSIFHKAGFLEAESTTYNNQPAISYKLTEKGWGELPKGANYSSSLCYNTGKWKILKILDYDLIDDQGSGLKAYTVKYEKEYVKEKWVTNQILKIFKKKNNLPKQLEAILIEGETGYFNPFPVKNRGLFKNTTAPNKETAAKVLLRSQNFLANVCMMDRSIEGEEYLPGQGQDCEIKPRKDGYPFKFYTIGVPNRGNMLIFKFSYINNKNKTRYGTGTFIVNKEGEWVIDNSFSLLSI
jgi:hypothetical protein